VEEILERQRRASQADVFNQRRRPGLGGAGDMGMAQRPNEARIARPLADRLEARPSISHYPFNDDQPDSVARESARAGGQGPSGGVGFSSVSPSLASNWQSSLGNSRFGSPLSGLGDPRLEQLIPGLGLLGGRNPAGLDQSLIDRDVWKTDEGLTLIPLGNPANPRLRREWERREGRPWPRDPVTGRNYDVAHQKALADGGTNTLDNIRPMHPDAHRAEHIANGDHARWGARPGIARAFGGTVARGLDIFSLAPIITGVLSGRIRTDTPANFWSDIAGVPSEDDLRRPMSI
jgi:hypothetical protein